MVVVEFFQFVVFFFVIVIVVVGVGAIIVVGGGGIHVFEGVQPNGGTVFGRVVVCPVGSFAGLFPPGLFLRRSERRAVVGTRNDGGNAETPAADLLPSVRPSPCSFRRALHEFEL